MAHYDVTAFESGLPQFARPLTPWGSIRRLALAGTLLIAVFMVGLGAWSATAPLSRAALASGTVVVETSRKTIQHLEGGAIAAILVHDGDPVTEGQALILLQDTKPRTTLAALQSQLWDALAKEARLVAERDERASVEYPAELTGLSSDPAVASVLAGQNQVFLARRAVIESKSALMRQRVNQSRVEIDGAKEQVAVSNQQYGFLNEELSAVRQLAEKGLDRKSHVLQLQGALAEIQGKRALATAQIARANQTIIDSEVGIVNLHNEGQKDVADALRETQKEIPDLRERIQNASEILSRTVIRAPEAGVVTDLRVHTAGGVVAPGEALLDLVPDQDRTVVEAQVRPEDIDGVHAGLQAQVRLLPFSQRRTPPVDGQVTYVSADRLIDKNSNRPYYAAKIRVDPAALARIGGIVMRPGMPSEVMIQTGDTTVALYALSPLLDSFHRAFHEK